MVLIKPFQYLGTNAKRNVFEREI